MDAKFKELVSKIRTQEVADTISFVRDECGRKVRNVLNLFVFLALCLLGCVAILSIRISAVASTTASKISETLAVSPTATPVSIYVPPTASTVQATATAVSTPTQVNEEPKAENIETQVDIHLGYYESMWEYLEYGNAIQFFHPDDVMAAVSFRYNDKYYYQKMDITPPQYRALNQALSKYKNYREPEKFQAYITIQDGDFLKVHWLEDSAGKTIWGPEMIKGPRFLNQLETWSASYAEIMDYDFLMEDWFDELPECASEPPDVLRCKYTEWSPAEVNARAEAFSKFVQDPSNGSWIEIWGVVDAQYRWIDAETGEVLKMTDRDAGLWQLPRSGWLGLQIDGYSDPKENWITTYKIRVEPGFVVGIDQIGSIFRTGPLSWLRGMDDEWLASRTTEWSQDKIMKWLPSEAAIKELRASFDDYSAPRETATPTATPTSTTTR